MEDDPLMRMYEAQAIAVEKQLEINELKSENEELLEELRKLKLEKSTASNKLDDVWTVINKLQKEMRESGHNLEEKIIRNSARLQQENEGKFEAIKRQIADVNDLLAQSLLEMNKFKEDLTGIKEQIKRNTDNVHSLQLQISKDSSKVDQIQERRMDRRTRFDSIDRTKESISQNTVKLNTILIMGGWNEYCCVHRTMTVLSADRSYWIELQLKPPYNVFGGGAVFLHNELYVVGGYHNLKALYKLDKNLEWKRLANMNVGRRNIANSCLEANGYIWVFEGEDGDLNNLKSVERYDPREDKWTLMPEMSTARSNAAAVFWKDRIIISGGSSAERQIEGRFQSTTTSSAECFLLETGEWTQFPPLADNFASHSLVSFENKLILMGGMNESVWEIDPLQPKNGWKSLPPMKYSRDSFPGLVLDQEIYAMGGYNKTALDSVEIFDGKSWRDGPSLPYKRRYHSAVIIPQSLADCLCQYKS